MLLDEIYNPRVFSRGFEKEQSHGRYRLVAKHGQLPWLGHGKVPMTSDQFRIEAYLGRNMVGWVNFEVVDDHLEAIDVVVDKKHRRQGIATAMYKFAKGLGNDISPSSKQTGMGRDFWATKSPVAEDLTQGRNLNDETAAYVKNHQWKLTTVNPNNLDVDGFDDPYGRVIDVDPDHPVNFKDPIIVDANGIIIDGFHRAYQAQRQGLKKLPAYVPVQAVAEGTLNEFDHARHVKLLNAYMEKLGYKNIGAGLDAQVFAKETGPVTKILMPESGDISTAENPFLAFYNYCQANARNPHLPKFLDINKDIELDGEKFRQITMERLQEVDPDYDDMIIDMIESIEEGQPLDPQYRQHAKFYQTLKSVMATGSRLGFENDIMDFNNSNVMQRGNTLVIADPWIEGGGLAEGQEHVDHDLMDSLMVKLCEMVIDGQKSPEDMGWVAAAVLDPNNNCVAAVNYALPSGKRVHGERAAIDAYLRRFGDIPSGSTIITTLSPCSEDMEERYSESCTDLLEQHGIKKVYAGYADPTQDQDGNFNVTITNNPRVKELCRAFAETFLPAKLDELSFLGSQCTKDCSGHRAGYAWYKQNGRQPTSWSPSFNKGAALAQAGK